MTDLDDLIRLRLAFERVFNTSHKHLASTPPYTSPLTLDEQKAWRDNEPDFTKRIVTPLKSSKPNEDETLPYAR
jgi:hypothetical protein